MGLIIEHFWLWFVAAFAVGVSAGYFFREAEEPNKISPWLLWSGLAFVAGLVAAALHVLTGRYGLYLEEALGAFASFILGAALVAGLRGAWREHKGWALGLVPAALVGVGAAIFATPGVESDLKKKAGEAVAALGLDAGKIDVIGRDIRLPKEIADTAGAAQKLAQLAGARLVSTADQLADDAARLRDKAGAVIADAAKTAETAQDKIAGSAGKTDAAGKADAPAKTDSPAKDASPAKESAKDAAAKDAAGKDAAGKDAGGKVSASKTPVVAPPAPDAAARAEKARTAKAALAALPAKGDIDANACQTAFAAIQTLDKIRFVTGAASIGRGASRVLDQLVPIMQRCPNAHIEIGGHTDNVGDEQANLALSQRRADAIVKYLRLEGIAPARLVGVGYGSARPVAANDDDAGRAENRRIEFLVK